MPFGLMTVIGLGKNGMNRLLGTKYWFDAEVFRGDWRLPESGRKSR